MKDRIFVALDVKRDEYFKLKEKLKLVKAFKIGFPLFLDLGGDEIEILKSEGKTIFLDFKLFDIPNTMIEASKRIVELGADFFTVHLMAGSEHLKRLIDSVKEQNDNVKVLGVTVLTSQKPSYTEELNLNLDLKDYVLLLTEIAVRSGLDGIVCSPQELGLLVERFGRSLLYVTPGIRPLWAAKDDQKRVMTPYEAFSQGADYIVVGRPITKADDPYEAFLKLLSME